MSIAQTLKSRTATIVWIQVLRSVSWGILGLTLPLYFASIGRSASEWGLASGAFAFTMIFAEPAWGWASDRIGAAIPLLAAGMGSAALVPIFALTGNLGVLLTIQLCRGSLETAGAPSSRKLLAHSLGPGRKAVGIGLFQACQSAGSALGPLLGGVVLSRWGYSQAFAASAAVSLAAVALTLAARPQLEAAANAADAATPNPLPALEAEAMPGGHPLAAFLAVALVGACLFAGTSAGRSFVPLLGTSVLSLQASTVALLLAVTGALSGPLTIVMGGLSDRWGRRPLLVGGLLAVGAALLGYGALHGFLGLAVCTLLLSLGSAAAVPAGVALVSDLTPYARQGRMIGLYGACENVGIMAGPVVCGFLWDGIGPRLAFVACTLFVALGVAASLCIRERR